MPAKRHPLTPAVQQLIVAYIRAGGFAHVAAEAAGVPRAVYERWLRRGQGPRARARYRAFVDAIGQARAQARLGAEVAILTDKPLDWLRSGPGRETPESPGWTGNARPAASGKAGRADVLAQPEVQALIGKMLRLLEAFPEARTALAAGIEEGEGPVRGKKDRHG